MRRVCAVCKKIFGCRGDGVAITCDQCENRCEFYQKTEEADSQPVHHGVCPACFKQKFVVDRPECKV